MSYVVRDEEGRPVVKDGAIQVKMTTVDDVVDALRRAGPGWHLASELDLPGSIQGIGNALRWAVAHGRAYRKEESRNRSLWSARGKA